MLFNVWLDELVLVLFEGFVIEKTYGNLHTVFKAFLDENFKSRFPHKLKQQE